jgi:hypothetical protein
MVELLLQIGSLANARNGQAARLAAIRRFDDILELLTSHGAAPFRSPQVETALAAIARRVSGPVVLLDIPESGGAALGRLLLRVFPADCRVPPQSLPAADWSTVATGSPGLSGTVAAAIALLPAAQQNALRFVGGPFNLTIREVLPPSRLFIATVRDPLERTRALYARFLRAEAVGVGAGDGDDPRGEEEFLARYHYLFRDYQVRALSGDLALDPVANDPSTALQPVTREDTERVLAEAAENFVLLGVAERHDESAVVLARQLGLPLTAMLRQAGVPAPPLPAFAARPQLAEMNREDMRLHAGANRLLDRLIDADRAGFERDLDLFRELDRHAAGESLPRLLAYELMVRGAPEPRLDYARDEPAPPRDSAGGALYLDLLEDVLINRIYADPSMAPWSGDEFRASDRLIGSDWPSRAHTMIGKRRIHNLRLLCEKALDERVAGDFIETGVWRGGATIMMRAVLKARGDNSRTVWVADSFEGVPPPDGERYPADEGDQHHAAFVLAISQPEVARNFRRYGLLDRQVRFLPGWFKNTLSSAPIERLAVLRLDGDLYESTIDALGALYAKVSSGGFVIIDDYGAVPGCRQATDDFRRWNGIDAELVAIDWAGVYWRKS